MEQLTYIRISEAARILNFSPQNIYYLIRVKKLKVYKQYALQLVSREEVLALKAVRDSKIDHD